MIEEIKTPLLSEEQASDYLSVSVQTLRRIRRSGDISYIEVGDRHIRYRKEHLDEYLKRREVQARK